MKHTALMMAVFGSILAMAIPAQANNAAIEEALRSRPDLSAFYRQLVITGVISELNEGQRYTIFAPVNEAFSKVPASEYPCFYSSDCKEQAAEILRRHIVPGKKYIGDITTGSGLYSIFSIDHQHVIVSQPEKDHFTINGQNVLSETKFRSGNFQSSMLYRIDGVLLTDHDLAKLQSSKTIVIHHAPLPPKVIVTHSSDETTPVPYK